jgi:hypothetical protein
MVRTLTIYPGDWAASSALVHTDILDTTNKIRTCITTNDRIQTKTARSANEDEDEENVRYLS